MNSIISALRAATTAQHEALHHHWVLAPLASAQDLTWDAYRHALAAMYGFHLRAWHALSCAEATGAITAPTPLWLAEDLNSLGVDYQRLPLPPAIVVESPAAALGLLYVKEGSLLGGRHLARAVRRRLGAAVSCRFFTGLGEGTALHWRVVTQTLEACPRDWLDPICAAACDGFEGFGHWLDSGSCSEDLLAMKEASPVRQSAHD